MPESTVLNIDCLEYMKTCKDKQFSLAICDPPYGINMSLMDRGETVGKKRRGRKGRLNSGGGHFANRNLTIMNCDWDYNIPTKAYFKELKRISENQIIWGGNYFPLPPTRCILFWDKMQPFENFSQFELAWTSFDSPAQKFTNCNRAGAESKNKIHPTEKPISLYKWILSKYAKEGDTIFDSHGGSMSSVIACLDMGFKITCCELDKDYYNSAKIRIENYLSQLDAFRETPKIIFK